MIGKRLFDVLFSFIALIVLSPLLMIGWLLSSFSTKSFGIYTQERIGQGGNSFFVYKLKTMRDDNNNNSSITALNIERITRVGKILRRFKIDELPQLINVLFGQMSFVGPRPDVPGYADLLKGEDREILSVRPGITGPASLKYKNEEELLSTKIDPKKYNDEIIWPDKVLINRNYVENYSFIKDLYYLVKTLGL